ncbi:MAG: dehydrogenase [Deltaproteobacteria bacterium]|nr:MAG: dehydrogenase [Deltaproteobacteria bacterium]
MSRISRLSVVLVLAIGVVAVLPNCRGVQRLAVQVLDKEPEVRTGALNASFSGKDEGRERLEVALVPVAEGFRQLTDIQPVPGEPNRYAVLEKRGAAWLVDLESGDRKPLFEVEVVTVSEQGLLGLAFHPNHAENGRFFVNYTPSGVSPEVTRVAEWVREGDTAREVRTVLEVEQPYQNHNAGQLAFGPDGMLYVGFGDGGLKDDPMGHGQNGASLLGSMLRLDVDDVPEGKGYGIPADNPFLDQPAIADEAFAIGLRNPWRYTFAPDGRLVVADVGQNTWEEIDLVPAGANLGWNAREGRHCFPPDSEDCPTAGLVDPVYEYGRDEGVSVTGGVVVTGTAVPELKGRYLFGDFGSARLWAITLPEAPGADAGPALALGRWPILPVAFATDPDGNALIGDFGGRILSVKAVN